jgi:hypothetical protein
VAQRRVAMKKSPCRRLRNQRRLWLLIVSDFVSEK